MREPTSFDIVLVVFSVDPLHVSVLHETLIVLYVVEIVVRQRYEPCVGGLSL
jgi:hypothetical protein